MIRRYLACVATLAVDALIWAMSYPSTKAVPETPGERLARYRREQEQAITHYIETHRKDPNT